MSLCKSNKWIAQVIYISAVERQLKTLSSADHFRTDSPWLPMPYHGDAF